MYQLIFYGLDGAAAKERATEIRAKDKEARPRVIHVLACTEAEPFSAVEFMPDVSEFERGRIRTLFGIPASGSVPPPPPPPLADPLDNLPREWKSGKTKELIALAASVTGRTPENREQAVALIEAVIAARAAQ